MAESDSNLDGLADVQVRMDKPGRVLHFSDGAEEIFEEERAPELKVAPEAAPDVDPKSLSWGPWISHYAWISGNKVVKAVDYAGEGLANFFGITTPKYQIEIDEHERLQEEKRKMDEDSEGWLTKNGGGELPLVTHAPSKDSDRPQYV